MLKDHVCPLFDQHFRRVGFLGRVKPCVGPDNLELDIGVHLLGVDVGRIDTTDHLGDRERTDIADDVRLGHLASDMALNSATFIEARRICRHVIGAFIAGGMFEFHIRKFGGDIDRRVHIAKRCGKDQVGPIQRHLGHDAFGIRALGHVFDKDGFHSIAKFLFDGQTSLIVFIGPASVADRADKDKSDFGFFVSVGIGPARNTKCKGCTGQKCG